MMASERYPKRKRQEISYFEDDFGESQQDSGDESEGELPMRKRTKPTKSRPLPKKKVFPLMKLPAELRNRIYEMALCPSNCICLLDGSKSYKRTVRRYATNMYDPEEVPKLEPLVPSLLAVSRQVWKEAAPFLYGQPIMLQDTNALVNFMAKIGKRHAALLRDVTIANWCHSRARKSVNFPAMVLLSSAVNLKRLSIRGRLGWRGYGYSRGRGQLHPSKKLARRVFRDCYPWLQAVGEAKSNHYAGLELLHLDEANYVTNSWDPETRQLVHHPLEEDVEMYTQEMKRLLDAA